MTQVAADGSATEGDAATCVVPPAGALEVTPGLSDGARRTMGSIAFSSGCRVVIGLDHPTLFPGRYGALYPEDDTPLLLDRSINLPGCAPPGMSTQDLLGGRDRARELIPLDDDEIRRRMLADARRRLGRDIPNLFLAGDYTRVPSINGVLASGVAAGEEVLDLFRVREEPQVRGLPA